jgi:hypothetical protein
VNPDEAARITAEAITNGRRQRREQGIPQRIEDPEWTARLAALLGGSVRRDEVAA